MAALKLLWMGIGVCVTGAQAVAHAIEARRTQTLLNRAFTEDYPSVRRWSRSPVCSFCSTGTVPVWSRTARFVWKRSIEQNDRLRVPKCAFSASLEAVASLSCGASAKLDFQQEGLFLTSHSGETFLFSNSTKFKFPVLPGTR